MRKAMLTVLVLLAAACAGAKARDHVLLPAMRAAWPGVSADAAVGAAGDPRIVAEIGRMTAALNDGDRAAIAAVGWEIIKAAAQAGVSIRESTGQIGPGIADSLRERIHQFDLAVQEMR